jgi:hypothetical protein
MMSPKRTKFRKQFKGDCSGTAHRGSTVNFGEFALKCTGRGRMTSREIEAARRAMTRHVKRGGQIWIQKRHSEFQAVVHGHCIAIAEQRVVQVAPQFQLAGLAQVERGVQSRVPCLAKRLALTTGQAAAMDLTHP